MRRIVLDTETTGLSPAGGHRIIEVAAIVLEGRKVSKSHFHHYLDPEREVACPRDDMHLSSPPTRSVPLWHRFR